jgi:hypothetical protein
MTNKEYKKRTQQLGIILVVGSAMLPFVVFVAGQIWLPIELDHGNVITTSRAIVASLWGTAGFGAMGLLSIFAPNRWPDDDAESGR